MGRLTKTSLHRVDAQDKVDEWEITLYEYDGRGLVTKETNALGAVTAYTYDGNGNLVSKTDADDYVTKYTYNALDFVTQINYNGGKQASYRYNKVGELVEMEDWTGTTSFEVDLLRRITQVTDRKGSVVEYTYDEVGNQTSIDYPDGTGVDYTYDLLHQLKTVTEDDGRATAYSYDGMGRVVKMEYPHGWVEDYVYDSIGQLLRVDDTDPTQKDLKQQKHVYKYDDCGNMIYEYMRGNGTGEATTENTYAYDALHRITRADEVYGKAWREYQYDSLGNLTYESNSNNVHYDYKLNNLNQITQKSYSSNDKEGTLYTYDGRGNLVLEQYGKLNGNGNGQGNGQRSTVGQYTYDETNKMVLGVNSSGESSAYLYNGLGALVEDTWKIAKNGYGYHDVDAGLGDADPNNGRGGGGSNGQGNGNGNGQGNGNGSGDKPTGSLVTSFSTVVKEFVVDYTSPTFEPLMEHEVNGLDYRYVYGNDRLSVNITGVETSSGNLIENGNQIRLYYHMDYLGTADYLTSPVTGKVESWTHYNEWGEITHNAVLKTGKRELDLVKRYATHDYDAVLGMYYAKARFYDAENRRFAAVDPILDATQYDLRDYVGAPVELVQYIYVRNQPVILIDPDGYAPYTIKSSGSRGGYELFITPYLLDSFIYGAGWIPGFSQAYDFLDWAILGAIKINASKEYLESLGMSVADHFFDDLHIGDAYNFVNGLKLLESLEDVPMNEALQNHFASKVWRSSTRKLVEEKYFTAISILSALIESGDVEIKKTEEVFNESDFTSAEMLGRHVYAYDSFMGRKEIFLPGHYYFFLVCKEKEGIGAEIESILKDIK